MVNDPLYNHRVFGPEKGKAGKIGKSDDQLIADLIAIHNAENWLGMDDNVGGGGGDGGGGLMALPPPPSSAGVKENKVPGTAGASTDKPRSDTPDSAVDVRSDIESFVFGNFYTVFMKRPFCTSGLCLASRRGVRRVPPAKARPSLPGRRHLAVPP